MKTHCNPSWKKLHLRLICQLVSTYGQIQNDLHSLEIAASISFEFRHQVSYGSYNFWSFEFEHNSCSWQRIGHLLKWSNEWAFWLSAAKRSEAKKGAFVIKLDHSGRGEAVHVGRDYGTVRLRGLWDWGDACRIDGDPFTSLKPPTSDVRTRYPVVSFPRVWFFFWKSF